MPIKPKAFVHIGTHKTGTSALQSWLNKNSGTLCANCNLLYMQNLNHNGRHHQLASLLGENLAGVKANYPDLDYSQNTQQIKSMLLANIPKDKDIIISSEALSAINDEDALIKLREILSDYDVHIIVYVRHILERIMSGYGQALRTYLTTKKISQYYNNRKITSRFSFNKHIMVNSWEKVLGADKVIVRPYIRSAMVDNDIIQDFLEAISYSVQTQKISKELKKPKKSRNNVNPSSYRLEILRRLNKSSFIKKMEIKERKLFIEDLVNSKSIIDPPFEYYKRSYFKRVLKKFKEDELSFAKTYTPEYTEFFTSIPDKIYFDDVSILKQIRVELRLRKLVYRIRVRYILSNIRSRAENDVLSYDKVLSGIL